MRMSQSARHLGGLRNGEGAASCAYPDHRGGLSKMSPSWCRNWAFGRNHGRHRYNRYKSCLSVLMSARLDCEATDGPLVNCYAKPGPLGRPDAAVLVNPDRALD